MDTTQTILFIAELIGTVAFAISGVLVAAEKRVDIFGALVLGTITAVGGGAIRDLLLGITPPTLFQKPVYTIVAVATAAIVFFIEYGMGDKIERFSVGYMKVINGFDAVGLAVFVVVGVNTAIASGQGDNGFLSIFVGAITGIGGGMMRDILAGQIPVVLRKRVYAVAAILGATVYYFMTRGGCPDWLSIGTGAACVMLLRFLATHYCWNLPRIPRAPREDTRE